MNLEPWFIFVDGISAGPQSRMMDMPRIGYSPSASALASTFAGILTGRRVLQNLAFDRYADDANKPYLVSNDPDDKYPPGGSGKSGLWIENGIAEMQTKWTNWFSDFTAHPNDGLIDHLYSSDEGWNLWDAAEYPPFGNPLFWLPAYWEDQMANPKWNTYLFWGKTMAEWLAELNPSASFPGNLPAFDSRDFRVAVALYNVAWRWWQRKIVHDTVAPFLPNCTFNDYAQYQITEVNQEPVRSVPYYYLWNVGPLAGKVSDFGLYLDGGPLGFDGADFTMPFPWVVFAANIVRSMKRSSWDPVMVHVAPRHYSSDPIYASTDPYYDEAIIHIILNQGLPNLFYFNNYAASGDSSKKADDESTLNGIITLTQSQCLSATTIFPITQAHVPYNSDFVVSAVYLNDTHSGVARVTFAPGVNSASFTLRGVPFTVPRPTGELGAWLSFGPILDLDNLTFDDANALTFDQANVLQLGSSNAMSFDEANALTFDQANALPD